MLSFKNWDDKQNGPAQSDRCKILTDGIPISSSHPSIWNLVSLTPEDSDCTVPMLLWVSIEFFKIAQLFFVSVSMAKENYEDREENLKHKNQTCVHHHSGFHWGFAISSSWRTLFCFFVVSTFILIFGVTTCITCTVISRH